MRPQLRYNVATLESSPMDCRHCGLPIPPPQKPTKRKPKEFHDSRCRSMYHLRRRQQKQAELEALLASAQTVLAELQRKGGTQ